MKRFLFLAILMGFTSVNAAVDDMVAAEVSTNLEAEMDETPNWKLMAMSSYGVDRAGLELSRKVIEGSWMSVSYSRFSDFDEYAGRESRAPPRAMVAIAVRHFPGRFAAIESEGLYVGGMLTAVERFKHLNYLNETVNQTSLKIAPILIAGWEYFPTIFGQKTVIRTGMGYGEGAPHLDEEPSTGGRINLSFLEYFYADFGIGLRF